MFTGYPILFRPQVLSSDLESGVWVCVCVVFGSCVFVFVFGSCVCDCDCVCDCVVIVLCLGVVFVLSFGFLNVWFVFCGVCDQCVRCVRVCVGGFPPEGWMWKCLGHFHKLILFRFCWYFLCVFDLGRFGIVECFFFFAGFWETVVCVCWLF